MRIGRPRTLLGLILMGLAIVTLPLLVGVGNAILKLDQLAKESGTVVDESATATLESQRLTSLLADMERNARQYQLLKDDPLLALYDTGHDAITESLAVLRSLAPSDETAQRIARLGRDLNATRRTLHADTSDDGALGAAIASFQNMNRAARQIAQDTRVLINQQLNDLQDSTREAQRTLAWQSALLVPGTAVLVFFFLILVGRPMRQVDRAIRAIGHGDFSHPIRVTGPTDIETLGRQLEWLRDRLEESTEEKNKFLRHMSHELKTPLANIREGTELLLDGSVGELDRQQEEVTNILRENALKLQKLIENLLTFSAWQTKTASLEVTSFELKPLVFNVLSQHRLVISNRRLKLQVKVRAIRVNADQGKLRLVLENLLSNAIKFMPDGGVLHVGAEMQGAELVIDVADNGPGIADEDRERVFEAFYRGRNLQGGHVGGTGIGLSVVAECVQAHGGSVKLLDSDWPGAHFQVRLPLRRLTDRPQLVVNA
jgi:two-component system sensor histidine kinase GlrK